VIHRLLFELRYLQDRAPWDTGISPPELLEFIANHPPGRALDLGCGTGTNVITLARHGWSVMGVDVSCLAIRKARQKAANVDGEIRFSQGDVVELQDIEGPFDLALDIGCFHSLETIEKERYLDNVAQRIRPGGTYLLYTWLAPEGEQSRRRMRECDLLHFIDGRFELQRVEHGSDRGHPSAWFTFRRVQR
jgi:SAM-dependent methyltransferase